MVIGSLPLAVWLHSAPSQTLQDWNDPWTHSPLSTPAVRARGRHVHHTGHLAETVDAVSDTVVTALRPVGLEGGMVANLALLFDGRPETVNVEAAWARPA